MGITEVPLRGIAFAATAVCFPQLDIDLFS